MMNRFYIYLIPLFFITCNSNQGGELQTLDGRSFNPAYSIAFLSDVHFHDVYAEFNDGSFTGVEPVHPHTGKAATIRTMEAQLTSTRLFNENYFAFKTALDDLVERGIQFVALTGDFSDDGQPIHLKGLAEIMDDYSENFGIRFFLSTGNHDPNRPFQQEAGKSNYLGADGKRQPIYSSQHPRCLADQSQPTIESHQVICTDDVLEYGYDGILKMLGHFGFYPNREDLYFETPFSSYSTESYTFETAIQEADLEDRFYEICHEGSGGLWREEHFQRCLDVPDVSYLVEPVDGLWILSLDANVYVPRLTIDSDNPQNPDHFFGTGNAGFNLVLSHKKHLIEWVESVVKRADEKGKHLIAFSHYPMADFYNGSEPIIKELWGEGRFQLARMPADQTSERLSQTGLQLHVGGHMHMNDTNIVKSSENDNSLINIQSPSIAGYVPAYKIVHLSSSEAIAEVETIILDDVDGFDSFFEHYHQEWDHLNRIDYEKIWNKEVLQSSSYREFTDWHMRELSRLRFLPGEWPDDIRMILQKAEDSDFLVLSQLELDRTYSDILELLEDSGEKSLGETMSMHFPIEWDEAIKGAGIVFDSEISEDITLIKLSGSELSVDFYRLRNAGSLAFRDISEERLALYSILERELYRYHVGVQGNKDFIDFENRSFSDLFKMRFGGIFHAMKRFATGDPDNHFQVDLESGSVLDLSTIRNPFID